MALGLGLTILQLASPFGLQGGTTAVAAAQLSLSALRECVKANDRKSESP